MYAMLCYAMLGALDASYGKVFDPFFRFWFYLFTWIHFCIHFCIYFNLLFLPFIHGVLHLTILYLRENYIHAWTSIYLFAQIEWCVRLEEHWRLEEIKNDEKKWISCVPIYHVNCSMLLSALCATFCIANFVHFFLFFFPLLLSFVFVRHNLLHSLESE